MNSSVLEHHLKTCSKNFLFSDIEFELIVSVIAGVFRARKEISSRLSRSAAMLDEGRERFGLFSLTPSDAFSPIPSPLLSTNPRWRVPDQNAFEFAR